MRTKIYPLLILLLLLTTGLQAQTISQKRGFGGDVFDLADAKASSKFGWYYNWGNTPNPSVQMEIQNYLEYVPMRWGAGYDKQALINYLSDHPEVKYILGFNEPNFLEQANLTPAQAAALWPEIEEIADRFNLKIVGPAVNFSYPGGAVIENGVEYTDPVKYLDDFFAACSDCRVDHIAIHGYFDNAAALPWYISLFRKYNKPIWLTEFNQSAWWVSNESQQQYVVDALAYLEKEPLVFRYAWFVSRSPQLNTNLFDVNQTGVLTDLGLIYANMSSYDSKFYHTINAPIEAEHYIDMSGIHLVNTQDASGILAAHSFDEGDWIDYQVDVPQKGTYNLEFRLTSIWESSLSVYSGDSLLGTMHVPNTNGFESWQTFNLNVKLASGKQKLRILPHSGGWKLNWLKVNSPTVAGCGALLWIKQTSYETNTTVALNGRLWKATSANYNKKPGTGAGDKFWQDLGECSGTVMRMGDDVEPNVGHILTETILYPNPTTTGFVQLKTNKSNYSVEVTDMHGQVLIKKNRLSSSHQLNVSILKAGTYTLKVLDKEGVLVQKFVVL